MQNQTNQGLKLRVQYWRTRRAMTIAELAERSKVSSATIVKIESKQHIPRMGVIRKLASALNVSLDDLWEIEKRHPKRAAAKVA